jgi:hypothetical protein
MKYTTFVPVNVKPKMPTPMAIAATRDFRARLIAYPQPPYIVLSGSQHNNERNYIPLASSCPTATLKREEHISAAAVLCLSIETCLQVGLLLESQS